MVGKSVWSVEDKVVLVTGGAAGIGAGLVRTLLSHNARVSNNNIDRYIILS